MQLKENTPLTMVHKTELDKNKGNVLLKPDSEEPTIFERKTVEYKDLCLNFTRGTNDFSKQFAYVYAARLDELRNVLLERIKSAWGNVDVLKLSELEDFGGKRCVIIGTLYKHQQWKPSILRELSEDHQMLAPEARSNYCSEKDQPFLEDEMLRIKLVGQCVDIRYLVTGVVCAVMGHEEKDGTFAVEDWCFPGCPPVSSVSMGKTQGKLILMSGLDMANNSGSLPLSLLTEWICGMAGNLTMQEQGASIVRVIIAGNTIKCKTDVHVHMGHSEGKAQDNATAKEISLATQNADTFLAEIARCCCVTLMSGQHDPTNIIMPQKPLHPCLLPKSARLESFKGTSNPWIGKVGETLLMGTSGQPIEDIMKVSGDPNISPLEWLEKTLDWRHICPTAPDTLPSYPYSEKDLFIMKDCPDIYFAGNMEKYETKLWKGDNNEIVRLICVPQFSTSHTVVTVDLDNLNTESICFGIG